MASPVKIHSAHGAFNEAKTAIALMERCYGRGLTQRDMQQCIDDSVRLLNLVRYIQLGCPALRKVFSAADMHRYTGLTVPKNALSLPVPEPRNGEECIFYYGGWTLTELCKSRWHDFFEDSRLRVQSQPDATEWEVAESGYYRFMPWVPGSNNKTWDSQVEYLSASFPEWNVAPTCIATTGFLALIAIGWQDERKIIYRSKGYANTGAIRTHRDSLSVYGYVDGAAENIYISAMQTC